MRASWTAGRWEKQQFRTHFSVKFTTAGEERARTFCKVAPVQISKFAHDLPGEKFTGFVGKMKPGPSAMKKFIIKLSHSLISQSCYSHKQYVSRRYNLDRIYGGGNEHNGVLKINVLSDIKGARGAALGHKVIQLFATTRGNTKAEIKLKQKSSQGNEVWKQPEQMLAAP